MIPTLKDNVLPLTDAKLKSLKPKEKAYKLADYDGLYVYIAPTGSRLWRFKYRLNGKEGLLSLGAYPAVSLLDARNLRDAARADLAKGRNPARLKQEAKAQALGDAQNTFASIAVKFMEKKTEEGRAPATLRKNAWVIDLVSADFGRMPIKEITAPIILRSLKKREKLGHYDTAKKMRSVVGGIFRYAIASGIADTDPTAALKDALIAPKTKHRAVITDKETLGKLLRAVDAYSGQARTRLGLRLLILFATRPGELRYARWDEFDLEARVWHIPAERMKMRKEHSVPLPDMALDLLDELRQITGWCDLLFPAQTSSKKPISENTFNQALRRMGFGPDQVTSHGFRATFSTLANESRLWHPDAIERAIAHVEKNEVRRAYDRGVHWEQRVKMADWWAKELEGLRESSNAG